MNAEAAPWHILGAGAIGSLWGAGLRLDGKPAVLIGRRPSPATGFTLYAGGQQHEIVAPRTVTDALVQPISRLLITTKAPDTLTALDAVRELLNDDAIVVVLQNGMVATEIELARGQRLLAATTTDGAYFQAPGELVHAGRGHTDIGAIDGDFAVDEAAALIQSLPSGLDIRFCADMRIRLWQKLALNCAINPLCAKYDCRNGELLNNKQAMAQLGAACAEISKVAYALNLGPWFDEVYQHCLAVLRATAQNVNSMLQDLRQGRRTEIHELNGFFCRQAERLGIPCPQNRLMIDTVVLLER